MSKKLENKKGRKKSTLPPKKKQEKYNLDNEIVIGLNVKPVDNQVLKKSNIKKEKKKINKKSRIIKYLCIMFLILIAILLFFMSPIFNIEEIRIFGNSKITTTECINLSKLEIGQNIYKLNKSQIKKNLRQNAYIDKISITRKLPNIIEITIQERTATFMLELENNEYAYINNQGYILEKNSNKIEAITITGFSTNIENINVGNRLSEDDLNKLETVLKIVDTAQSNNIIEYITKIDIEDKNEYKLILEGEQKTVYLGDASSISTRMLYVKAIIEKETGKAGEVFVNGNINTDKAYFREQV